MNICLVGNLHMCPERFLPLVQRHAVSLIYDCNPSWPASFKPRCTFTEIPSRTVNDDLDDVDLFWYLISPWDGLEAWPVLRQRYPHKPMIRQIQGGLTPFWHTPNPRHGDRPNYDWQTFTSHIEDADGLMVNATPYLQAMIDQDIDVAGKPLLMTNGMAIHGDICGELPAKLRASDGSCHVACIGRYRVGTQWLDRSTSIVHVHAAGPCPGHHRVVKEPYLGDAHVLRSGRIISLAKRLAWKARVWPRVFGRYDVGLMHLFDCGATDVYNGQDVNLPGRVNTYMAAGMVPLFSRSCSSMMEMMADRDCALIAADDKSDIPELLADHAELDRLQGNVLAMRHEFTAQAELSRIEAFLADFL